MSISQIFDVETTFDSCSFIKILTGDVMSTSRIACAVMLSISMLRIITYFDLSRDLEKIFTTGILF